jgi:hypothetical protein
VRVSARVEFTYLQKLWRKFVQVVAPVDPSVAGGLGRNEQIMIGIYTAETRDKERKAL